MNGKGCTGEADQTSKAGQFWRLRRSTWKKLYAIFSSLSCWKPVQFSQERCSTSACRCLENESGGTILKILKLSIRCWGIPDNRKLQ